MSDGSTWATLVGEKEDMYVWIDLADNCVIDTEIIMQGLRGYICAQAAVLELVTIVVRDQVIRLGRLLHQYDRIQNLSHLLFFSLLISFHPHPHEKPYTRDRCRSHHSAPNDTMWCSDIVEKIGW